MAILQLDAKLSIRESLDNVSFNLNRFFLRHSEFFFRPLRNLLQGQSPRSQCQRVTF
jgi:hypothetical protein